MANPFASLKGEQGVRDVVERACVLNLTHESVKYLAIGRWHYFLNAPVLELARSIALATLCVPALSSCDRADPAADFPERPSRRIFEAELPAFDDVEPR